MRGHLWRETTRRGVSAVAAAWLVAVAVSAAQNPEASATRQARWQDPRPPLPYDEVQATIVGIADGTRIEGTSTLPRGGGPCPAVLLLSGAGAQDRDYSAFDETLAPEATNAVADWVLQRLGGNK